MKAAAPASAPADRFQGRSGHAYKRGRHRKRGRGDARPLFSCPSLFARAGCCKADFADRPQSFRPRPLRSAIPGRPTIEWERPDCASCSVGAATAAMRLYRESPIAAMAAPTGIGSAFPRTDRTSRRCGPSRIALCLTGQIEASRWIRIPFDFRPEVCSRDAQGSGPAGGGRDERGRTPSARVRAGCPDRGKSGRRPPDRCPSGAGHSQAPESIDQAKKLLAAQRTRQSINRRWKA